MLLCCAAAQLADLSTRLAGLKSGAVAVTKEEKAELEKVGSCAGVLLG